MYLRLSQDNNKRFSALTQCPGFLLKLLQSDHPFVKFGNLFLASGFLLLVESETSGGDQKPVSRSKEQVTINE